ncbi:DUF1569 domain-containing protein [Arenimonas composti]|uniref:Twin-arginine translocation pathway signal n=1 Tax=Arenimonas composti TR7-09 = DSM 18010 TaxID=1121013 RepID=A0A091BDM6_9GAMM|nr:DUF1569 domain-containing protein [Arenimonas composti]KFN50798.1 hypothetical protein P873_05075 [Arenimonas composti TR7-09 = DSM 18010]
MKRRTLLKGIATGTAAGLAGGAWWLAGDPAAVAGIADLGAARAWVQRIAASPGARSLTAWPLAQVLEHCAQSIEFSLDGFPEMKPAWFQASAGTLAFRAFARAGAMRHGTTEPIPGAPALAATDVTAASDRLLAALDRFAAHAGPLQPHFAYGALDRAQYTRAHLLHLAEHAGEIDGLA